MTTSIKLQLGSVVVYKNEYWLAVAYDGVSKLTIMQPCNDNKKRVINPKSLTGVTSVISAKLVTVDNLPNKKLGTEYLVTRLGYVISKKTLRIVSCDQIISAVSNVIKKKLAA